MCGSYFKSLCKYSVQEYTDPRSHRFCFKVHEHGDPKKIFCKTEYLNHFLHNFSIEYQFDLLTHNSDLNIDCSAGDNARLLQPNLRHWYAQNLNCRHPMMSPLPIGIANPKWKHGSQADLKAVKDASLPKTKDVYVNFDIYTNQSERTYCLEEIGLPMENRVPFRDHLRNLASSFFCVSPNGNGLDCHRHWESIYLKTIPIVTRSNFTEILKEKGLPLLIIDDWSQFKTLQLTEKTFKETWNEFNEDSLNGIFI